MKTVPLTARLDTPGYRTDRPTFEEIAAHAKAHPLAGDPDDDPGTLHGGAWWIVAGAGLIDPCGMMVELIPREWFSAWFDEITQVEHTASKRRVEWVELSMHTKAERGDFSFFTGRFPGCEEFRFYALDRDGNIVQRAV